ncbi:MAG: fumarylacetoacetate hydrolase family protein, partial [Acidobacteriaceae bacterium]|nr:fumarylacetoacetate hydrolase family protein [Acidobacteriaceae bacterium]
YAEHAAEIARARGTGDASLPSVPTFFTKAPTSLAAHEETLRLSSAVSTMYDWEAELAVVIGQRCRDVAERDAHRVVFGYTCVNDVTARDLQRKDGQWTRGKGFDTFCAVGPCVVTKDEIDLTKLRVRTHVDGQIKQDGAVAEMMFDVAAIIAYVTEFMTLEPGDLIATGTPPGVGPLQPGSTIQIEIDGIGILSNPVVSQKVTS